MLLDALRLTPDFAVIVVASAITPVSGARKVETASAAETIIFTFKFLVFICSPVSYLIVFFIYPSMTVTILQKDDKYCKEMNLYIGFIIDIC
ncbi:hypothetical protein SDC9_167657 [bioreactor metagenome]|uniref:Uncharacterized protein n=1 Tax=bioreactor metagenome TaxID=1076179 RepID=A0A645G383_9ZZZZ